MLCKDPELEDLFAVYRGYWKPKDMAAEQEQGAEALQEEGEEEEEEEMEHDPYTEDGEDEEIDSDLGSKLGMALAMPPGPSLPEDAASKPSVPAEAPKPSVPAEAPKPSVPAEATKPKEPTIPNASDNETMARAERLARIALLKCSDGNLSKAMFRMNETCDQKSLAIPGKKLRGARWQLLRKRLEEPRKGFGSPICTRYGFSNSEFHQIELARSCVSLGCGYTAT